MSDLPLDLPIGPQPHRRGARLSANGKPIGRPPGSRNRGSVQLGKWVETTFGGLTPGQVAAELSMVRPADVARAKKDAEQLVALGLMSPAVLQLGMTRLELAQAVKAVRLAKAIGCETREAYLLAQRERSELMRYIHQAQPMAKPKDDGAAIPTVFLVPEGEAQQLLADFSEDDPDILEIVGVSPATPDQVAQPKSNGDT